MQKFVAHISLRVIGTLILLLRAPMPSFSQNLDAQGNLLIPSPQAWCFAKYGNTPVNLYTGTVSVEIPLYVYEDNDFRLPVSAGYASNGLMPGIRPGILGAGWFLNAGGIITREIKGIPDETYSGVGVFGYYHLHRKNNPQLSSPAYMPDLDLRVQKITNAGDGSSYETEPDVFHFNLPGCRGSFFLGPNGQVHVYDTEGPQGEIRVQAEEILDGLFFTITTGDGYRYTFGSSTDTREESCYGEDIVNSGNGDILHDKGSPICISAWLLHTIEAPNRRTIRFNYMRASEVNYNYRPQARTAVYVHQFQWAVPPFDSGSGSGGSAQTVLGIRSSGFQSTELQSIDIDGRVEIRFAYREEGSEILSHLNPPYDFYSIDKLDSLVVVDRLTNRTLRTCRFAYRTPDRGNPALFLKRIDIAGEAPYRMDYYDLETDFPTMDTYSIDHWGYYNGQSALKDNNFLPTVRVDANYDETISAPDLRAPDATAARKGMLKTLIYPTGGHTLFEYEANDYSGQVVRSSASAFLPALVSVTGNPKTGGLRIRRMTDHTSDSVATWREFVYENAPGISSGILLQTPRYSIRYRAEWTFPPAVSGSLTQSVNKTDAVNSISTTIDHSHIGYSRVIEKRSDGSSVEHLYTDYKTMPDSKYTVEGHTSGYSITAPSSTIILNLTATIGSAHLYRGKPARTVFYDSAGKKVRQDTYLYDASRTEAIETGDVAGDSFYRYKRHTGAYPLKTTVRTEYFSGDSLVSETRYAYNALGQTVRTEQLQPDGTVRGIRTWYVSDLETRSIAEDSLLSKHMLQHPLRVESTTAEPGKAEAFTGGTQYKYGVFGTYGLPLQAEVLEAELSEPLPVGALVRLPDQVMTRRIRYDAYDDGGNILQTTDRQGTSTGYIWGYGGLYPIAKAENVSIDRIGQAVPGLEGMAVRPLTDALSPEQEKALRELEGASVTTSTFLPHVGISSVTDPSGRTLRYEYDPYGRLKYVLDEDGHILERYEYNYKH